MDTIFALATAPGKAGVAVVRMSGPLAHRPQQRFVAVACRQRAGAALLRMGRQSA